MYQVIVKGKNLEELKKALLDITNELMGVNVKPIIETEVEIEEESEEDLSVETVIKEAIQPIKLPTDLRVVEKIINPVVTLVDVNSELDAEGLPWDNRIHASSKAKVKDGTWRIKRGIDDSAARLVKDDLRNKMQASGRLQTVAPVLPIVPEAVVPSVAPIYKAPPYQAPVAQVVQQPVVPVAPPTMMATNGHTLETFKVNFPMILACLITEKKIDQNYVNQLKAYFNVPEIWNISEAQKEEMFYSFVQFGFIQKV